MSNETILECNLIKIKPVYSKSDFIKSIKVPNKLEKVF